jgi:radical SAM superfamily enzyme YgiQ (UPF0313 family)
MRTSGRIRITLVSIHTSRSPQSIPLAAAFLSVALKNAPDLSKRINLTLTDLYTEQTLQECTDAILATEPDMVGFSIYTWNRLLATSTAIELKKRAPGLMLFCGGPEPTADQLGLLSDAPWDFLIHGEGEAVLTEVIRLIAKGKSYAGTPGIAVLESGKLKSVPAPEQIDLEKLPSPLLSGEIDPFKYSGMLWQISRGCSFDCDFCFDGGGSRKVRRFPFERIKEELQWFVKNRVSQVFVLDSTFNSDKERAVKILKLIKRVAPDIHFHFEVRSEFIDREQAELFAAVTCSLQIGLQGSDPAVLKKSGRNFIKAEFKSKVALLNDTGAIFGFDLIYGLPGDTLEGFRNSLDFAISLYPNHLDIFPLALLPGTRLAAKSTDLGLRHQQYSPYLLTASPTFPESDIAVAREIAAACDTFYSRGKAVSWFMSALHLITMKPSRFLEAFYRFATKGVITLEELDRLDDAKIFKLQTGFITELFTEKKLKKFLPIALDMIYFNYHYAAALMATPQELPDKRLLASIDPARLRLKLSGSARLATFSYEILEILGSGIADLRELAANFSRTGSTAVIYPKNGEVLTESLFEPYFRLLEKLDGERPAGEIAESLGIPLEDTESFLKFALMDGIVALTAAE